MKLRPLVLGWKWREAPLVGRDRGSRLGGGEWKVGRDTRSGGEGEDQAVLTSPITNLQCVCRRVGRAWWGRGEAVGGVVVVVGKNHEKLLKLGEAEACLLVGCLC